MVSSTTLMDRSVPAVKLVTPSYYNIGLRECADFLSLLDETESARGIGIIGGCAMGLLRTRKTLCPIRGVWKSLWFDGISLPGNWAE